MMGKDKLIFVFLLAVTRAANQKNDFEFNDDGLTATEGSCVQIKGSFKKDVDVNKAYWIWLKDAQWNYKEHDFVGTVVHSTDVGKKTISPEYEGRVTYIKEGKQLTMTICDLKTKDNGKYSLRFYNTRDLRGKWHSSDVSLLVEENPCLVSFEERATVHSVTLQCSTLSSCTSRLLIKPLDRSSTIDGSDGQRRTVSYEANWEDNGRQFSCQTEDNNDPNLVRNLTVNIHEPRETRVSVVNANRKSDVVEKDEVTLVCSSRGNPEPTYNWYLGRWLKSSGQNLTFNSIKPSDSGTYTCEAQNDLGYQQDTVRLNVQALPEVKIKTTKTTVRRGIKMSLQCMVKNSDPEVHRVEWKKDGETVSVEDNYVIFNTQPEHRGIYTCTAWNRVGSGTSSPQQILVEYKPTNTRISTNIPSKTIRLYETLKLTCDVDAYPPPQSFYWYKTTIGSSNNQYLSSTTTNSKTITRVQRSDEGCYQCDARNSIGRGDMSEPKCIEVLYPPSKPKLIMNTEVTEGQNITIRCDVESSPLSELTLMRNSETISHSSEFQYSNKERNHNTIIYTFKVMQRHTGLYSCLAENTEGRSTSEQRQLVVKYKPMTVEVQVKPSQEVKENTLMTFQCQSQSHPPVTSVTWTKTTNGIAEDLDQTQTLTLQSVSSADSGEYRCTAHNEVGASESPPVNVRIMYVPRDVKILKEQQLPDQTGSVTLTCSAQSYPQVQQYLWYRKKTDGQNYSEVSSQQNHTVDSDKPGIYYCSARNQLGEKSSEPLEIFLESVFMKVLKYVSICASLLLIPLVFCVIFKKFKHRQEVQAGPSSEEPLNYTSVHFRENRKPRPEDVYAVVSKQHKRNKAARNDAKKSPSKHDSSDQEVEMNYSEVKFTANRPNCKVSKSSSFEEEETEYSSINI